MPPSSPSDRSAPAAKKLRVGSPLQPWRVTSSTDLAAALLPIDSDDSDSDLDVGLRHKRPYTPIGGPEQPDIIKSLIDNVPLDDDAPVGCRPRHLVKKGDWEKLQAGDEEDEEDNLDYEPVENTSVEEEIKNDRAKIIAAARRLGLREETVQITRKEEITDDGEEVDHADNDANLAAEDNMEVIRGDQVGGLDNDARRFREITEEKTMWRVPAMVTTLMNHQVLGLDWMASRELLERPPVGGLVADEMGLGKTMQSIAVMLLNPPEIHDVDYTPVTLIVAPLSLLRQWKEEIINHCKKRTLRVFIHHGDNRIRTARDLRNIDVVLCTYNAIMYSWPRRPKDGKRWTQKAIDDWWEVAQHSKGIFHRIKFWRVILDECHLIKNRAGATSEACQQLSAVNKWALSGTPIPNSLYDLFPIFSFIGHPTAGTIEGFRWLVGTHPSSAAAAQRVQAALRGNMMRRTKSDFLMGLPLISLPRKRIRMVELEFSDDERALYKAVELHSIDRINKYMREGKEMKEFAILTMLLRLRQMCDHPYLVLGASGNDTDANPLSAALVRKRFHIAEDDEDEKSDVSDSDVKREQYGDVEDRKVKPEQSGDAEDRKVKPEQSGDAEDRKVKPEHSRGFEDRNVKREYSAGVEDRKVKRENSRGVEDSNLKRENSAGFGYEGTKNEPDEGTKNEPDEGTKNEPDEQDTKPMAQHKLELSDGESGRRHPKRKSAAAPGGANVANEPLALLHRALQGIKLDGQASENELCPICSNPIEDPVKTRRCKHQFCRECLMDSLSFSPLCPFNDGRCGTMLKEEDILPGDRGDGGVDELNWLNNPNILMMPSTKTTLLRKQLAEWRLNHPGDKIVLFSQFTKMLDIIERVFENEEPDQMYVRYDGSMSVEERDEALGLFRTEPECNLILISIKAGGVGLNLTHANLVICIDLWWNAAVELQAFDRVHRLGQKKEVFVTRCIVKDTVEERMLALQKRKMLIAKAALGEGRMALGRLTRKELLGLFGRVVEQDGGRQVLAAY